MCVDGLRVGLMTPEALRSLCAGLGLACEIVEVDRSSVFCEIVAPAAA